MKKVVYRDSRQREADPQKDSDRDGSLDDELDEGYWSQLLDDAHRMQLETADEDVDVEIEP